MIGSCLCSFEVGSDASEDAIGSEWPSNVSPAVSLHDPTKRP